MGDDVQLDRPGARVVPTDGVPPTDRPLAAREHQHDVLAGLIRKVLEPVTGQKELAHPRPQVVDLDDLQLEQLHARNRQQPRRHRKRESSSGL